MATQVISGVQYSGSWSLSSQANAKALGTWPSAPMPHLFAWGYNAYGQLGLSNTTSYSSPKQVGSLTAWSQLSTGGSSSMIIKTDGTLWTWGRNTNGKLGLGDTTNRSSPVQVGALTNWYSISCAGSNNALAIKTDGTLWAWGQNDYGQLGLNNLTYYSSPTQVGLLTNWAVVSAGHEYTLAVKTNGTLWAWGYQFAGELGDGSSGLGKTSSPVQVGALTDWAKTYAGYLNSYGIKTDGTLWSWGANNYGQLGLGNTVYKSSPNQVGALSNWLDVAGYYGYVLAIKTDGTLWAWGRNAVGQLGLGNITNYSSPKQVGALTTWSKIYAGRGSSSVFAIKTDGTLWAWGINDYGQLGLGNTTYYSSPKQVGSGTTWQSASVSFSALAIASTV